MRADEARWGYGWGRGKAEEGAPREQAADGGHGSVPEQGRELELWL